MEKLKWLFVGAITLGGFAIVKKSYDELKELDDNLTQLSRQVANNECGCKCTSEEHFEDTL